jgi:hypothetical protein
MLRRLSVASFATLMYFVAVAQTPPAPSQIDLLSRPSGGSQTPASGCPDTHAFTGLPLTDDCWHDFDEMFSSAAYSSSRFVYVDPDGGGGQIYTQAQAQALGGTITNPNSTPNAYTSITSAYSRLRDGNADVMLLMRGKTFSGSQTLSKSGASARAPIVVTAYGAEDTARPDALVVVGNTASYIFLSSMKRDFGNATDEINYGQNSVGSGRSIFLEDIHLSRDQDVTQSAAIFSIMYGGGMLRRSTVSYIQAFVSTRDSGLTGLVEESTFSYSPVTHPPAEASGNSNIYFQGQTKVNFTRNQSFVSNRQNFRNRRGGVLTENLAAGNTFWTDSPGDDYGGGFDMHIEIEMYRNIEVDTWGPNSMTIPENAIIDGNIFSSPRVFQPFRFSGAVTGDLVYTNNILYSTTSAEQIHFDNVSYNSGASITFTNNDFIKPADACLLIAVNTRNVDWGSGNRFYSQAAPGSWFCGDGLRYAAMTSMHGTALLADPYPDPTRGVLSYVNDVMGCDASDNEEAYEQYLLGCVGNRTYAGAHNNRRGAWDEALTPIPVINHIREGFGLEALE